MFVVSAAKREILKKLTEQDWAPTDLAGELGKSPETVYNHLNDLAKKGILSKRKVAAKTRPKTKYSIDDGFIQYIAVLPSQFTERALPFSETQEVMFRIWDIPQRKFHSYLEQYYWSIRLSDDIDFWDDISAIGVYGSVARGEARTESDLDLLVIAASESCLEVIESEFGSIRFKSNGETKICMTEVYTLQEYRTSLAHGSDFLVAIQNELHSMYDPDRVFAVPRMEFTNEQ